MNLVVPATDLWPTIKEDGMSKFFFVLFLSVALISFLVGMVTADLRRPPTEIDNLTHYEGETPDWWVEMAEEKKDGRGVALWIRLKSKHPSSPDSNRPSIITFDDRVGQKEDHICIREDPVGNGTDPVFVWRSNTPEIDSIPPMTEQQLSLARDDITVARIKVATREHVVEAPPKNWPGAKR